MTLYELTGQESGIIIIENSGIIVANWLSAGDDQIPLLSPLGNDLINFPLSVGTIEEAEQTAREVDDILAEIPKLLISNVIYDYNNDIPALCAADEPTGGTVYMVGCTKIIAPYGWA